MITVHEHGLLARGGLDATLECSSVPESCWDWLCEVALKSSNSGAPLLRPIHRDGRVYLKLSNYVGVLETPNKTIIEILPKISDFTAEPSVQRALLMKMLAKVYQLPLKHATTADLKTFHRPLLEVLIGLFLSAIGLLIKRGIKSDYCAVEEQAAFLKGRLRIADQLKQPLSKRHVFQVSYDEYLPDRPENRLIHLALRRVLLWSKFAVNQRRTKEYLLIFASIPLSTDIESDFKQWRSDRAMVHYRAIKNWCHFILRQESPLSLHGKHTGISMLFPMEQLFEKYVALMLSTQLAEGFSLKSQMASKNLVRHRAQDWFRLKPDLAIMHQSQPVCILDSKWKLLDSEKGDARNKYGLSQADLYQMFAYGEKYLDGQGDMYLIYPSHSRFSQALAPFAYNERLRLHVVAYDLATDDFQLTSSVPVWFAHR